MANRNSTRKRVSRMNPSAAGNADRADATTVGPEHLVRCLLQFVPNVESILKYPSSQLKAVRYSVWNASKGKNKQHYKIRLKNRASCPVFIFLVTVLTAVVKW